MAVNPFDPKSVLLARHAQHVVLVHFPIALFVTGAFCDVLAHWTGRQTLKLVAQFDLWAAAITVIPVVATGLAAWQWQLGGQRLKGVLRMHLLLGSCAAALVWIVVWVRSREWKKSSSALPAAQALLELLAVLVVAVTGHLGGFVSGVNLPG